MKDRDRFGWEDFKALPAKKKLEHIHDYYRWYILGGIVAAVLQVSLIVTIAGKHCESGDAVVIDMPMQHPDLGDIVAVFGTGAYCYTMASNYNGQPRPAIVFVKDGQARVVTRRETYADLYHRDI